MKKDKSKSKSHETNIGKIIYGFLLFMPLLAISVKCAYAIFNKNAYKSYSDEYVASTQPVTDQSMLQENNNYSLNAQTFFDNSPSYTNAGKFKYNSININWNDILPLNNQLTPQELDLINGFVFYKADNQRLQLYNNDVLIKTHIATQQQGLFRNLNETIYFELNSLATWSIGSYSLNFTSQALYILLYKTYKIDEVFYYSIKEVEQSNLFNWAQNSTVYTTLTATCTALSINNTFIPLLLAYWLIISIIYILYDIALVMLMIFHRKVHELQDCI